MINQQTKELLQAGVDGELDAAGEAELRQVLRESAEARQYHAEMTSLVGMLEEVPGLELPKGLHTRTVQGIRLTERKPRKSLFSFMDASPLFRYGLAGAAALVLAIAITMNRDELVNTSDVSSMVGTMTRPVSPAAADILDRVSLKESGLSGEVTLERRAGAMMLSVVMDSAEAIEIDVDFSGNGLALDAFAHLDSQLDAISYSNNVLSAKGKGSQRFVLMLNPESAGNGVTRSRIDLVIKRQGTTVQTGSLDLGGA
jgi:hypothetical protein